MATSLHTTLRAALVAALRANTVFASVMGYSVDTRHVEGGDQPDLFLSGHAGHAFCRLAGQETIEQHEASARTAFKFSVHITLADLRGAADALAMASTGLGNVMADRGAGIFTTYFTDTGSNRLGGSGEWTATEFTPVPLDVLTDPDRPEIVAEVTCDLWHVVPLITT